MTRLNVRYIYLYDEDEDDDVQSVAKTDMFSILDKAPNEAAGVLFTLRKRHVDGTVWQESGCGCLIGTIGILQGTDCDNIPGIKKTDGVDIQDWFANIELGDTPATNEYAAKVEEWILEWQAAREAS